MADFADLADLIRPYVEAAIAREDAMVEQACEAALQMGDRGVLVRRRSSDWQVLTAEPDLEVPYGQLHEMRV